MQLANIPSRITTAFAAAAGALKRTIPTPSQSSIGNGAAASWTDGFPAKNAQISGGIAPSIYDFNGVLFTMSSVQQWQCGGGLFAYDAAWSTANTGYAQGALLLRADGKGYWRNTVDANTANPDTGGAGWSNVIGNMFGVGQTLTGTSLISAPTGSVILLNSAGAATATLPTAVGIAGQKYLVHVTNAGGLWTIASSGGLFNGSGFNAKTSFTAGPLKNFTVISDGTNWIVYAASPNLSGEKVWTNVKASRALGTPYPNDTGREITISVSVTANSTSSAGVKPRFGIFVDGLRVALSQIGDFNGGNFADSTSNLQAPIPAGATYQVAYVDGTNVLSLVDWVEYR